MAPARPFRVLEKRATGMDTQAAERAGERVTVEMSVGAYRITGARPERGVFARFAQPEGASGRVLEAACGIGVLVEAGVIRRRAGEAHHDAAYRELGRPYAEGFAWGFDGQTIPDGMLPREPDRGRMLEGHRDGRALWAAVRDGIPDLVPADRVPSTAPSGT